MRGVKFNHKLTVTAGSNNRPINIVPWVRVINKKPYEISLYQSFLLSDLITTIFLFLNVNGNKHKNASVYRSPAYVRGGISVNPHFIRIKEVDHRKVTNSAKKIALR
jgi:hypothetical protein